MCVCRVKLKANVYVCLHCRGVVLTSANVCTRQWLRLMMKSITFDACLCVLVSDSHTDVKTLSTVVEQ